MSSSHIFPVARELDWCTSVVDAYGATGVVLSESTLDLRALRVIGREAALATGVLPLAPIEEGGGWRVFVASARPLAPDVIAALEARAGLPIVVVLAAGPLLAGAIAGAYKAAANGARVLAGVRSLYPDVHLKLVRPTTTIEWLEPVALG